MTVVIVVVVVAAAAAAAVVVVVVAVAVVVVAVVEVVVNLGRNDLLTAELSLMKSDERLCANKSKRYSRKS
jgi:hypothetical protein